MKMEEKTVIQQSISEKEYDKLIVNYRADRQWYLLSKHKNRCSDGTNITPNASRAVQKLLEDPKPDLKEFRSGIN